MVAYGVNDHSILRVHGHPNNQTEDRIKNMLNEKNIASLQFTILWPHICHICQGLKGKYCQNLKLLKLIGDMIT